MSPIPCCCLVDFHADVWAVATVNGASLCCAWAGLEHVLDSAPQPPDGDASAGLG